MAAEKAASAAAAAAPTEDAFAELRRRLAQAVRRVCPPALADRADDIVQEGMLRVMAVLERNEGAPVASSYLRAVAYSTMIDELRRARVRHASDADSGAEVATQARSPEEAAGDRQLGAAIRDCLSRLPEPRRVAVTLHLQGHSVPEAAELLDWSEAKTRNLVYRGLADLRGCLDEKGVRR